MERLLNVNIRRKTGFTLVELLIVVAIIGLLAAIAVPSYNDYVTRTKITNMINAADQIKTQVSEYRNVNGNFDGIIPGDTETTLTNIGASDPTLMAPTISSIEFAVQDEEHMAFAICGSSAGQGTATDDTVDIYFTGTVLTANTLGATANAGGMTWGCAYEGNGKYVPSSCRTLYDPGTFGTLANTCVH